MKYMVENSHFFILPFILILAITLIYRAYKYHDEPSGSIFVKFGISSALMLITVISTIILPLNLYLHAVVVIIFNTGLYIVYQAIYRILTQRRPSKNFVAQPIFLINLAITCITVVFDLLRITVWVSSFPGKDMPSFHYPQWYTDYATRRPEDIALVGNAYWIFNTVFFIFYNIGPAFLLGSIVWQYIITMRQRSDVVYLIRRIVCMFGFLIGLVITVIMAFGVISWILNRDDLRISATYIYQSGKIFMLLTIFIGFLIREEWLSIPIKVINRFSAKRRQRQYNRIVYLHQRMTQIVPTAIFPIDDDLVDFDQILTEISDARRFIWGDISSIWITNPQKEAEIIFQLLSQNTVITKPGKFPPPPISARNIIQYNDAVAIHLQYLESQKTSMVRTT